MAKVYFAGSIRGGRADAALYNKIIEYIKNKHDVLTEHVGDLDLSAFESEDHSYDRQIYLQDMKWMSECDFVVAECTVPSLGVGYELCYAEKLGKPVHIYYRKSVSELSAMLTGDPYFDIHQYETWEDIEKLLEEVL